MEIWQDVWVSESSQHNIVGPVGELEGVQELLGYGVLAPTSLHWLIVRLIGARLLEGTENRVAVISMPQNGTIICNYNMVAVTG